MKIIKAIRTVTVPVKAMPPARFIRKTTYPPGEIIVVHEETLKTLKKDSYEVYSGNSFVSPKVDTKKKKKESLEKKTFLGLKKDKEEEAE